MDILEVIKKLEERVKALENGRAIGKITLDDRSADPASPAAGKVVLYFKSGGVLYYKRADGTVVAV
jgi:hypothetical protein